MASQELSSISSFLIFIMSPSIIRSAPYLFCQESPICLRSTTDESVGKDKAETGLSPMLCPQVGYRNIHSLLALPDNLLFAFSQLSPPYDISFSFLPWGRNGRVEVPRRTSGDNENINRLIGNIPLNCFQFNIFSSYSSVSLLDTPWSRKSAAYLCIHLITDFPKWHGCGRKFPQENLEGICLVSGWHSEDFPPALEMKTMPFPPT